MSKHPDLAVPIPPTPADPAFVERLGLLARASVPATAVVAGAQRPRWGVAVAAAAAVAVVAGGGAVAAGLLGDRDDRPTQQGPATPPASTSGSTDHGQADGSGAPHRRPDRRAGGKAKITGEPGAGPSIDDESEDSAVPPDDGGDDQVQDGTDHDGTNPDGTNPDGTNPDGTNPDGTDQGDDAQGPDQSQDENTGDSTGDGSAKDNADDDGDDSGQDSS